MTLAKVKNYLYARRKYLIVLAIFAFCAICHSIMRSCTGFANFLNFGPAHYIRAFLSLLNYLFPFSIGETVIMFMPLFVIGAPLIAIIYKELADKVLFTLMIILCSMYALFVFSFAPAYASTPADELFGYENKSASLDELKEAALILTDEINALAPDIDFTYASFSKMNYSLDTLSKKLGGSYTTLSDRFDFINNFPSRLKPIALSVPLTYTHISGVYSYYTGESNININFPDYTIPFTSAHEMAHARGFARENEANFIAFVVCEASPDTYIRYSGKLNILEYILGALSKEDPAFCAKILMSLDIKVYCDMASYNNFFTPYSESTASSVASALNDTMLKSNGVKEGEQSYGLVIDLAVAYILDK